MAEVCHVSSTLLELAISMIFLYLMLSAASSAIQEIIANMFRWRAKTLEKGIAGLFGSAPFKDEFYKLPIIESLCSPNARGDLTHRPSYIAPATFALAVLDLAAKQGISLPGAPAAPPPAANVNVNNPVAAGGAAAPNAAPAVDPLAKPAALLTSLLRGATDVEDQRKRLESWFNDSMDRVSGWYKRTSNVWLWIIGGVLCVLVNADSISLAKAFWNDPTMRAATVAAATEHVKNPPKPAATNNAAPTAASGGSASAQTTPSDDDAFKRLNDVKRELATSDIPLGWCWTDDKGQKKCFPILSSTAPPAQGAPVAAKDAPVPDPRMIDSASASEDPLQWWFLKLVGLTLTVLAISQGAPFWFDLLQKAVNLRLAGDPPDEKPQKK
jgi:hypothetical protein